MPAGRIRSLSVIAAAAALSAALALPALTLGTPAASAMPGRPDAASGRPAGPASWKIIKTVRGTDSLDFTAVTATSRRGAWAFESAATAVRFARPTAWRLSNSRWTRAPFAGKSGEIVVSAASTSADDVWAVTSDFTRSRALSWNGRSWIVTGTFPGELSDVVALGRHDAWVFGGPGRGGTWHYDGRWSEVPSGRGLLDGSALSPNSIWAVGTTRVAHWNGHSWSRTSVARMLPTCPGHPRLCDPRLSSIYAQSPTNVWAIATGSRESIGGPVAVLHFDGRSWRRLALNSQAANPGHVIPDGKGGLWIPILAFEFRASTMLHYSAGQLRFVALPGTHGRVLALGALAAVPGGPRAIGVGQTYPNHGVLGLNGRAVILAYGS